MAGLQYNFFPTDILYPRSKSVPVGNASAATTDQKSALPSQQYYFFPTDFFYPRPQSVQLDTTRRAAASLQTKRRDVSEHNLELTASVFDSENNETNV